MDKYRKASIVITAIIGILIFIPTFNYSEEHFGYHLDFFEGVSYNSRGITDYNKSVVTLGISGYMSEKYGFFIVLAGIALILAAIFFKSNWILLAGNCLPVIGSVIQIICFYNQPHMGTRVINQPPYIAFGLIVIELLFIIVSVKNLSTKNTSE